MSRSARVLLHWLVDATAGKEPPRRSGFSRPARFDHQGEDWNNNAWSLVIKTEGKPDTDGGQFAIVQFLMREAPHDWLAVGRRFTLFEDKPIANGLITEVLQNSSSE
jgi:hypothetical protein